MPMKCMDQTPMPPSAMPPAMVLPRWMLPSRWRMRVAELSATMLPSTAIKYEMTT